jgi:hypothetical protein
MGGMRPINAAVITNIPPMIAALTAAVERDDTLLINSGSGGGIGGFFDDLIESTRYIEKNRPIPRRMKAIACVRNAKRR